jgi:hypothetical protein
MRRSFLNKLAEINQKSLPLEGDRLKNSTQPLIDHIVRKRDTKFFEDKKLAELEYTALGIDYLGVEDDQWYEYGIGRGV